MLPWNLYIFFPQKSPDLVKFELYCRNNEFLKTGTLYAVYGTTYLVQIIEDLKKRKPACFPER